MIDHYDWPGGREAILRFGPPRGPVVLMALPFFEEANRMRAFAVTLLRSLGNHGIVGALPDLPAAGESLIPTNQATLAGWRQAFAAAADHAAYYGPLYNAGFRSGALLTDCSKTFAFGAWHLAPQSGPELLRELGRVRQAGGSDDFAGNAISDSLLAELETAEIGAARTVRLDNDARAADLHVPGAPQWRRAEPDNDPALAALLAEDIAAWVRQCEG